jgi:hypothetical protein
VGSVVIVKKPATDQTAVSATTGQRNTGLGVNVMLNNTTGSNNISLGYMAGANLTTGNNNIDIANAGVAAESNAIRVGVQGTETATRLSQLFFFTYLAKR